MVLYAAPGGNLKLHQKDKKDAMKQLIEKSRE